MARIDYASGMASIWVDRPISVYTGPVNAPPHYNATVDQIRLGQAYHLPWDEIDIHGVLVHECSHVVFPAPYPKQYHQLANLIDDCRIERQMSARKPHLESSLRSLVINVLANRKYDEVDENGNLKKDPWSEEHFDPSLWALLYFRHHITDEIRSAANAALKAWAKAKELSSDKDWQEKFRKLVRSGLAITRLAKVSERTLEQWCELFLEVFPQSQANDGNPGENGNPIAGDTDGEGGENGEPQENGDKGENAPGQGDKEGDEGKAEKVVKSVSDKAKEGDEEDDNEGGSKGSDEEHDADQSREAEGNDELRDALAKLREKLNDAGKKAEDQAKDENPEHEGISGEEGEDDSSANARLPGVEIGAVEKEVVRNKGAIDASFVSSFVRSIRKMTQVSNDKDMKYRRTGKLDMGKVVRSKAAGFDSLSPFRKITDLPNKVPVSCVVATDNSGSTDNIIDQLNSFTHNTLYALRKAKCESAGVVWNTMAETVVNLRDQVSAVSWKRFSSMGGTSLIPCAHQCVKAAKGAKGRKIAFIFTDGSVWEHEVPEASKILTDAGFAAALIISLGSSVPRSGIVDTVVARSLSSVAEKFDKWVKNQYLKGIKAAR